MSTIAQDPTDCKCRPGDIPSHCHCASCGEIIEREGPDSFDYNDAVQCQRCGEIVHTTCRTPWGACKPCYDELFPPKDTFDDAILPGRLTDLLADLEDCIRKAKRENGEELIGLLEVSKQVVVTAIELHREIYARTRDLKPGPLFADILRGPCFP